MPKGRKPTPHALKLLMGKIPTKHEAKNTPEVPAGEPVMPDWLSGDAIVLWRELAGEMARIGIISRIDGGVLGAYCAQLARLATAERDIAANGIVDDEGERRAMVRVADESARQVKGLAGELGLTAVSRTRIHMQTPKRDEFESFLDRKGG